MSSSSDDAPVSSNLSPKTPVLPSDWLLGLATAPMVMAWMGGRMAQEFLLSLSEGTEEVFRGDRLPVLHFPNTEPQEE